VRYLETAVAALFWWHPVVWWARHGLRAAEERCCDMRVVEALPDGATDYARGLLKTVEFIAGAHRPVPSLASGIGAARMLEQRLNMIIRERTSGRLSRGQRVLLAALLPAVLLFVPIAAERAAESPEASAEVEEDSRSDDEARAIRAELRDIEREQRELELRLQRLEERRRALTGESGDVATEERIARLELQILELERSGRPEEAGELRKKLRRLSYDRQEFGTSQREYAAQLERRARVQAEIRGLLIDADELDRSGSHQQAEENRLKARELQEELVSLEYEAEYSEMEMSHEARAKAEREFERQLALERALAEEAEGRARVESERAYGRALELDREIARLRAEAKAAEERGEKKHAQQLLEKAQQLERQWEN
jgi:hypothetical protein